MPLAPQAALYVELARELAPAQKAAERRAAAVEARRADLCTEEVQAAEVRAEGSAAAVEAEKALDVALDDALVDVLCAVLQQEPLLSRLAAVQCLDCIGALKETIQTQKLTAYAAQW